MDLAGNLTAPEVAALFPYDYVCMAYEEDEELFQKKEEEDIGEVKSYPMTRVTTVQGAPASWIDVANNYYMKVIWPQGQHVGISENTYMELRKNLGLPADGLLLTSPVEIQCEPPLLLIGVFPLEDLNFFVIPYMYFPRFLHAAPAARKRGINRSIPRRKRRRSGCVFK